MYMEDKKNWLRAYLNREYQYDEVADTWYRAIDSFTLVTISIGKSGRPVFSVEGLDTPENREAYKKIVKEVREEYTYFTPIKGIDYD